MLLSLLRPEHPRLFLNEDMWPATRERALGEGKAHYERMQETANGVPPSEEIVIKDWGRSLAPAAFVYRMTGDKALLEKIKKMLQASLDQYDDAYSKCETWDDARKYKVSHAETRMSWLAAIDWVWNDLEPAERLKLASGMLRSIHRHLELYPDFRNWSGSYYAGDNLYWYTGVALLDKDLEKDDYERGLRLLREGYCGHQKMFEIRGGSRMDDGAVRPRLEYTLPAEAFSSLSNQITIAMWVYGDTTQPRNDTVFYAKDASGNKVLNIHLPWSNSRVYWDAGKVQGTIETDMTLGPLSSANITAWSLMLDDGDGNSVLLTPSNSLYSINGDNLTATPSDLLFDFTDGGTPSESVEVVGDATSIADVWSWTMLTDNSAFDEFVDYRFSAQDLGVLPDGTFTGVESFAKISMPRGVPESGSAILLLGMAVSGLVLLQRRH